MKRADFGRDRSLHAILAVFGAIWFVAAVAPRNRMDWAMENLLVVSLVLALAGTYRIFPFSDLSYLCIGTFLTPHTVGAHHTYPEVPLGEWARDAAYELLEWGAAAVLASEAATAYLGAQGDAWDAQNDMLAGGLGALLAMTVTGLVLRGSAIRDHLGARP